MPHIDDACPPGEHELEWRDNTRVCVHCGLSSQTIRDWLGHRPESGV